MRRGLSPLERTTLHAAAGHASGRALVAGAPLGDLAVAVRALEPDLPVDAIVNSASEKDEVEPATARVLASIDEAADRYGLVVWRPTGREGKARQRELACQLLQRTRTGGRLLIFTHKSGGASAIIEAVKKDGGTVEQVVRSGTGQRLVSISPGVGRAAGPVPSTTVFETRFAGRQFSFETAPGLFSRGHLDQGTCLLLHSLAVPSRARFLDLGCGYGAVGIIVAACHPDATATLVDKDPLAVKLAQRNTVRNGVNERTDVRLSDGIAALPVDAAFDLVAIHFPLHIPRQELVAMLADSCDRLAAGGRLVGVLLRAYDLTPQLCRIFATVREVASDERFVVLECMGRA
jgi:16S rRNA (guanine1207-N2)-methyltransferase